jgi:phage tail sheath protein FI
MLLDGYPGVYVQEVPSGVRTIIAASTSTFAIVGHFPRGPVGIPVKVTSWNDVVRSFGELDRRFVALYTLQDFFLQGGSYAWVNRIAFERPTVTLNSVEKAMVVEARTAGAAGDSITIAISTNADGSFNLVTKDGANPAIPFDNLSADPASPRFVERVVNAAQAEGGSALISVRGTAFPPATLSATALAGGGAGVKSSLTLASLPQPALTLQGLDGWASASRVTATANGNNFDLVLSGHAGGPASLASLTVAPGGAYVVDQVGGTLDSANKPVAAVVLGRHPLRVPVDNSGTTPATLAANASLAYSAAGQPGSASANVARAAGGGNAMVVAAANPGSWGNNLRVGIAAVPGGFDMLVNEYRGTEVVASESFRGLSVIATDAQFAEKVVNETSQLIRLSSVVTAPRESSTGTAIDKLALSSLLALAGGGDGTLPGEPAWAGSAAAVFNGDFSAGQGIPRFDEITPQLFNIMAIPEAPLMADKGFSTYAKAGTYCSQALAFLLVDHPIAHDRVDLIDDWDISGRLGSDLARSAAICFPRLLKADPLGGNRQMQSSGAIAGLMARIDGQRGVWKAPAGLEASISGVVPTVGMTDKQQAGLNKAGINCMRVKPGAGTVQWGARTLAGSDTLASEWKYVPVRRTALMIEQTLRDSLGWVVFEPNDEGLWAQIRLNIGAFMQSLFVQGAFQGRTPREAYLVKCDGETTSQQDVNSGIVNILVGFAPLKPAEFVVVRLTQLAGRLAN